MGKHHEVDSERYNFLHKIHITTTKENIIVKIGIYNFNIYHDHLISELNEKILQIFLRFERMANISTTDDF